MRIKKKFVLLVGIATIAAALGGCGNSGAGNGVSSVVAQGSVSGLLAAQEAQGAQETQAAQEAQGAQAAQGAAGDRDSSGGQTPTASQPAQAPRSDADAAELTSSSGGESGIDVDLTALSSIMVYSEVYNMLVEPTEYLGKTVKMNGAYNVYYNETKEIYYFTCIIQDATACCAQGMEFKLSDTYAFPEDYPSEGDEITVVGVFDTYMEGGCPYYFLRDARLV